MANTNDFANVDWSELIVIFNSLLRSIAAIREQLNDDDLDDDLQYDLDEELNDYVMLLNRLKVRFAGIPAKGQLAASLKKKLDEFN
jgi:hypothetical protein